MPDRRLTPLGHELGLVDEARWQRFAKKHGEIERTFSNARVDFWQQEPLAKVLRRTEAGWPDMIARLPALADVTAGGCVPGDVRREIRRLPGTTGDRHPAAAPHWPRSASPTASTTTVDRATAASKPWREKLSRVRPSSLAQASRISGITPADLALVMVHLDGRR